ncbi:MAG: hypothetical protein ABSG74_14380 [Candidatus Bathyarchaeia archaeon]
MIHLSSLVIIEIIIGLLLWWIGVYLLVQNPFSRLIQLLFGIFTAMSFYLTSDLLFYAADFFHQPSLNGILLKIFIWTLYLPVPFLYHLSLLLIPVQKRKSWQKISLYFAYLATVIMAFIEAGTNLTRNYSIIYSSSFSGNFANALGKYFWLIGVYFILVFFGTTVNFYTLLKDQKKFSKEWYKYFWPLLGLLFTLVLGPMIMLGYYNIIPHSEIYVFLFMFFLSISLIYSIFKYDLLIEEAKIIFGRPFIYSTLAMILLLLFYFLALFAGGDKFTSAKSLITPYILIYLIVLTHPAYDWLSTFVKDIMYNVSSGISVVNDAEVNQAIRNYNDPEKLENSSLLRLSLVDQKIRKNSAKTPVDSLRTIIQEAIDYCKPTEDINRRAKKNLKYHLLKMIAFDQAEEGQILWELGFEEYPLRIMSKESQARPPLFKASSPSDYNYVSRNAYMALKKEAVHNITWRISYLEKLSKKKI